MAIVQLDSFFPVEIMSDTLPKGVKAIDKRGTCIAWWVEKEEHQWLVCLDQTGEFIWVPMHEIRMQKSWSNNRRY